MITAGVMRFETARVTPYIKSLLSMTAHIIKNVKLSEMTVRLSLTNLTTVL